MSANTLAVAIVIAFGFTGWTIIASYSRMSSCFVSVVIGVVTAVVAAIMSAKQLISVNNVEIKSLVLLIAGGIVNGLAFHLYSNKIADTSICTPVFVVTVSILMAVIAPILNWMVKGEIPNVNQCIGFMLAAVTIYFLNK